MEIFRNYVGQLRLYSLADLVLMLFAINAGPAQIVGAVFLHVSFLAYLENRHSHEYRAKIPVWTTYVLLVIGLILYWRIEGFIYLFLSFLYTKKTKDLGFMSPIIRGLQNMFMVAGVIGYYSPITYLAGTVLFIRNLAGDFRDAHKDKQEGMKTIPVIMGVDRNVKHIHLVFTVITSCVWWYLSSLWVGWLIIVIFIQIFTYNLTPR